MSPEFVTFSLPKSVNPHLSADVTGQIIGDTIRLITPTVVTVDSLIPVFTLSDADATVRVAGTVQRSGQSQVDFTGPVSYVLMTAAGAERRYIIDVVVFTGLPVITVTTDGGAPILSREDYVNATIEVYGGKSRTEWSYRGRTQIRGRGNSTWWNPKKPYRIKLSTGVSMLGFPADRDWAFLANYWDITLTRNATAFELSRRVGMEYTPRCSPFELILNGVHRGSYQLCDHQEVAPHRIPAGSTGWHLELVSLVDLESDETYFSTPRVRAFSDRWGGSYWVYKAPDPPSVAQREVIEDQMLRAETVLYGGGFADPDTGYAAHFDVESVIDWYLVNELVKNNDATFFKGVKIYRPSAGKIKFGPVWDFDLSFGRFSWDAEPIGWRIKNAAWIARFFEDRAFVDRVKAQWGQLYSARQSIDQYVVAYSGSLLLSQRSNHPLWFPYEPVPLRAPELSTSHLCCALFVQQSVFGDADYFKEVAALRTWLNARWAWLNTAIMGL